MSFEDLPPHWPTLPLTDPAHIADVLDLMVDSRARSVGSLLVLICDERHRPLQPVVIEQIDPAPPPDIQGPLSRMAGTIAESVPGGSVLFAIARWESLRVTEQDLAWKRGLEAVFGAQLHVLGVHLVTMKGSVPIVAGGGGRRLRHAS